MFKNSRHHQVAKLNFIIRCLIFEKNEAKGQKKIKFVKL